MCISRFCDWMHNCVVKYVLFFLCSPPPPDLMSSVPSQADAVRQLIARLVTQAEELLPKIEDVQAEKMGDLVDQEMALTTKAIEDAASKIAVIFCFLKNLGQFSI